MANPPNASSWKGLLDDTSTAYLDEVTPPASLETLIGLNALVYHALSIPYALTALSCDTLNNSGSMTDGVLVIGANYIIKTLGNSDFTVIGASANTVGIEFTATGADSAPSGKGTGTGTVSPVGWHWAQRINAGCAYLRGRFHVGLDAPSGAVDLPPLLTRSTSSGTGANDEIQVPIEAEGTMPGAGQDIGPDTREIIASDTFAALPTEPTDRAYEANGKTTAGAGPLPGLPYTEGFSGSRMHGMSALWVPIADMGTL